MKTWTAGVLVVALAASGCDKKASAPAAGSAAASATPPAPQGPDPSEQAIQTDIEAYNLIVAPTSRIMKEYRTNFDGDAPTLDKMNSNWCSSCTIGEDEYKKAAALIDKTKAAPPTGAMGTLPSKMDAMLSASKAIAAVLGDVKSYYKAETFKEDKGAKGLELHAAYREKAAAYVATVKEITALLDAHDKELLDKELAKYAAQKDVHYWMRLCFADAKRILGGVKQQDLAAITAGNADLSTCLEGYEGWAKGAGDKLSQPVKAQLDNLKTFADHTTKTVRDVSDPKTPNYTIDGDFQNLSQFFNNVVQSTNNLMDAEAQGVLK